jgi:hypothetical protein
MGKVIGALVGLIATALYAVAAAELLGGETGVDLLAGLKTLLPDDVLAWLARAPLASPEGAPMWRAPIAGVAIAAGAAGGLLLLVTARLSAVLLWLSFLLFLGVLVGQDLGVTGAWSGALEPAQRPDLIARGGVLAAAFVFALIANIVTGEPKPAEPEIEHHDLRDRADDLRQRLRAQAARGAEEPPPEPPARRARPPEPRQAAAPLAPEEPQPAPREPRRERDLDRMREPPPEPPRAMSDLEPEDAPEPPRDETATNDRAGEDRSREERGGDDRSREERDRDERVEDEDLVPVKS